jgi:hypothetical protein
MTSSTVFLKKTFWGRKEAEGAHGAAQTQPTDR